MFQSLLGDENGDSTLEALTTPGSLVTRDVSKIKLGHIFNNSLAYDETGGRAWPSVAIKLGRAAKISDTSDLDSKAIARASRDRNDSKHCGHFTGGRGLWCGGGHRVGGPNGASQLQAEMQAESYGNGATTAQLKEREDEALRI
ncbi:hypothetical protein V502_06745 [Pseudogymnoascus sp. VKM F-4520 (FW-2644)]|nr:hypothetical protein V502_06745 [Pseudogymnoascus sp. VKM F-4520 (FW-2644)]